MQLEQEVLLVVVCKLTFKATSTRALSQRGVKLLGRWMMWRDEEWNGVGGKAGTYGKVE